MSLAAVAGQGKCQRPDQPRKLHSNNQIIKAKQTLNEIIAKHTDQPLDQVAQDGERDRYFTAQEAKEYGLVDEVFEPKEPGKKPDSDDSKKKDA